MVYLASSSLSTVPGAWPVDSSSRWNCWSQILKKTRLMRLTEAKQTGNHFWTVS